MTKLLSRAALAAGAIALGISGAYAGGGSGPTVVDTKTFQVSVQVAQTCTIQSINAVTFASQSAGVAIPSGTQTTGQLKVLCPGQTYSVAATAGLNPTGSNASFTRNVANGSNLLAYTLYTDPNKNTVWGDNGSSISGSPLSPSGGSGSSAGETFSPVAVLTAGQTPVGGTYSDTITVQLSY